MKVSTLEPYKVIYSLYEHEYLGYLFESFAVQLDEKGRNTLRHQNISYKNANEFANVLDEVDYELIKWMDSMQQNEVVRHFTKGKIQPGDFFTKVFENGKSETAVKEKDPLKIEIQKYLERRRGKILPLLKGKELYEMGKDGEPSWRKIEIPDGKASVRFHFHKNEDNTHYFPTIKHDGKKIEWRPGDAYIICNQPAWFVVNQKLLSFDKNVDGLKLKPFLRKKFIMVPERLEEEYYKKFVAPLMAAFDVRAYGFDVVDEVFPPIAQLKMTELASNQQTALSLFDNTPDIKPSEYREADLLLELIFNYGPHSYKTENASGRHVTIEKTNGKYTFRRIERDLDFEKKTYRFLTDLMLPLRNSKIVQKKSEVISWLSEHYLTIEKAGIKILQHLQDNRKYFLGATSISLEIKENIDWFDVFAVIKFGEFEIPFLELRKVLKKKQREIILPDGSIGIIPESWLVEYAELFAFAEEDEKSSNALILKKHHLALVNDLGSNRLAKISMNKKLEQLRDFAEIEDTPLPVTFAGELRPYQKAGYNWLNFLNKYTFGGCLADDMGLGKTVQTLAMLLQLKESGAQAPSLLIMPTSLMYNWEVEAAKFTPALKTLSYSGTGRNKDVSTFLDYDLVFTSYGIARLDAEILQGFLFNYIILDESQAIKNPSSNISKSVKELRSTHKLILTGTPLENSTLDLWSQMTFINPGLLGSQNFFKKEFLLPIEKHKDETKTKKLFSIIKPFILRRHKSQVATELPEKIENIQYCTMTTMQEEYYEALKNHFRDKILDQIDAKGYNKSQIALLQGLSQLRQAANHPSMIDPNYQGDSGKFEDVIEMLTSIISEQHKVLVFSQFVKHLSLVRAYLDSQSIPYAYLDGSTKDRQEEVLRFQNDKDTKIFLISIKAGGVGLNLTSADYVFILDPWWNPAVEAQAIDRAHRIGQLNTVFTYKFITKNSIEEKLLKLQERKIKLYQDLIVTEESFIKDLSQDDISMLLS